MDRQSAFFFFTQTFLRSRDWSRETFSKDLWLLTYSAQQEGTSYGICKGNSSIEVLDAKKREANQDDIAIFSLSIFGLQ